MVRRSLAVAFLAVGLALTSPAPASAGEAPTETTTTLPVDQGDRSVIPAPNSGREPTDSGDRGGWAQLALFGIMAAGSVLIFGRVLWAGHQRSRIGHPEP